MQKTHIYIDVKTRRHVQPNGQPVDRTALYPELERGQWQVLCFEFVSVDEDDAGIITISPVSFASGHSYLLVADNDFDDDDNLMLKSLQSSVPFDESDHNSNMMQIEGDWIDGTTADITLGQLSVRVNNDTVKFATVMNDYDRIYSGLYINVKQYTSGIANPSTIAWLNFTGCNTIRDWSSAQYTPNPGTEVVSQVKSSLNNSFEFLFDSSDSGDGWHTDMVAQDDQYFKMRLAGLDMPWSLPKLIPYGPQGLPGIDGTNGSNGTAATVAVGSVTQGETPSVVNVGTNSAAILDFVLVKGDTGSAGTNGTAATIAVGSVTQGETPSVTNVGTENAAILDFVLAKGDPGSNGVGVPSVTSDDAGKVLTVDSAGLWGAAMPAELTGFIPTSEKGAAFGVAELDSAGKVPASQLPESAAELPVVGFEDVGKVLTVDGSGSWGAEEPSSTGGIDFSTTSPSALGDTAVVGTDTGASRADHVHPNTGLVKTSQIGAANGVAGLDGDGLVPLSQLPEVVGGVPEATNAQVATAMSSYYALSPNKYITVNAPIKLDADIPIGDVSFKQMTYPQKNAWYSTDNPVPPRLVFSPYLLGSYATHWCSPYPRCVIVKLTEAEALDMAFESWRDGNLGAAVYPVIDMSTGAVLEATGNTLLGYEWDKLNVVAEATPHDASAGYVSYVHLSQSKQRYLYENSTAYTGTESYHGLAEAYAGKWVLCKNRNIIGTADGRLRTNFVDSYGHAWPDLDMPGQIVDRIEFYAVVNGWTMPSWSDNELNSDSIPAVVIGQQPYEFGFAYIGGGIYKYQSYIKSELSMQVGTGDPTYTAALATPFESSRAFYLGGEPDQMWGWCSKLDWSGLEALLKSIAQLLYKVYESRTLSRFNSYLRLKPPQGAATIEVLYSKVESGTATETEGLVNIAGTKENATYVCNLTGNETNPQLLRYVDISGNDCTKEDANTVLLNLSGLPPEVDNVAFRWYYSPELYTKWLNTPVQVADSTIIEVGTIDSTGQLTVAITGVESAQWSVDSGSTWSDSGAVRTLVPGSYVVAFSAVSGYTTPINIDLAVSAGLVTSVSAAYVIND